MRPASCLCSLFVVLLLVVGAPGLAAAVDATIQESRSLDRDARTASRAYVATDLGTLGGTYSGATSVNDRGQVVGVSETASGAHHGFLWEDGAMTDLGTMAPAAINRRGQIVGQNVLWQDGESLDLGGLGGLPSETSAVGINDRGQVVGTSRTSDGRLHAFLWLDGVMIDLVPDHETSRSIAINDRGQVLGAYSGGSGAFLWEDGVMVDLGTLGGATTEPRALNDRGQVVGASLTATGDEHAFLWEGGRMTDLGTLDERYSGAIGINERGQVVGRVYTNTFEPSAWRAFLWQSGTMTDLAAGSPVALNERGEVVINFHQGSLAVLWRAGELVELGGLAPYSSSFANDMNRHGQVVGESEATDGAPHAFLWLEKASPGGENAVSAGSRPSSGTGDRSGLQLRFTSAPGVFPVTFEASGTRGPYQASVFDVRGRRIRRLEISLESGRAAGSWDGVGSDGIRASAGVYFMRLESNSRALTTKVVLVR